MDSRSKKIFVGVMVVGLLSIALSSYALAKIYKVSLPLPSEIPILTMVFPILSGAAFVLSSFLKTFSGARFNLPSVLTYLSTLLPIFLLVYSFVYGIQTPMLTCSLENQWLRLFRNKDVQAIRAIQDTLRCCGFNSVRDRAWPFPAKGITAHECERTQGYHVRCLDAWRREESTAASMVGIANLGNCILIALLAYLIQIRPRWQASPSFTAPDGHPATRLLGARDTDDDDDVEEQAGYVRNDLYSDLPASEDGQR